MLRLAGLSECILDETQVLVGDENGVSPIHVVPARAHQALKHRNA